eukprot:CAMPEP_0181317922 /NCGR_PEP_ID=MMETSP1101-20121128/16728_1 /TAXON_ID=46948 /ORGANISM="Rhodomonas abbreviata, Strain Caron Lab Isolate" /LENGTH=461 /DNA_ID=CAMNT_0023425351 /DNA_START=427 /DNA_END=1809 /DNA_ORIENTATION=-
MIFSHREQPAHASSSRTTKHCSFVFLLIFSIGQAALANGEESRGGKQVPDIQTWAKENDMIVHHAELRKNEGEEGLSLFATENIEQGQVVMSVPAGLLFPTRVEKSPVPAMIENTTIGRVSAMCLYLAAERVDPESFWAPWIQTLPKKFFHALSYTEEDMEHFQASPFRELRARKVTSVHREYVETVVPLLDKLPKEEEGAKSIFNREAFSYEAFVWAYSVITTRAIFPGLLSEKERAEDSPLIIVGPYTDSLNHGPSSVTISFDSEQQRCLFSALLPIAKGDLVSVGIGQTSNLELLANRGLLLQSNRNNFVLMKFQLDMSGDMHATARQAMMGQLNLSNPQTYIVRNGEMPQGLLTSLRIQSLTPVEFGSFDKALSSPVTLENEWRAYRLLISSCNAILNMYPTTIEEDEELLGAGQLRRGQRSAVVLRRQEKLVYESVKAWAHDAWSSLLYASAASSQ